MPRNSLLQALAIQDVLQTYSWGLIIPRVPGTGSTRALTSKCISTSLPGSQIERTPLEAQGGIRLGFAGRRIWDESWEATFIEDRSADTRDAFIKWMDLIRNPVLGTGTYKSVYAVPIELSLYDDVGIQVRSLKLVNAFPTQLGNSNLDQSNGIVQYSVTFSLDLVEETS